MHEFVAYRVLFYLFTANVRDIATELSDIEQSSEAQVPCVKHAIDVFRAWHVGNYARFFRLYLVYGDKPIEYPLFKTDSSAHLDGAKHERLCNGSDYCT